MDLRSNILLKTGNNLPTNMIISNKMLIFAESKTI